MRSATLQTTEFSEFVSEIIHFNARKYEYKISGKKCAEFLKIPHSKLRIYNVQNFGMYSNHRNYDYDKITSNNEVGFLVLNKYGGGGMIPLILNISTRWISVASFTMGSPYLAKKLTFSTEKMYSTGIKSDGLTEYFTGSKEAELEAINRLHLVLLFLIKIMYVYQ